MTRQAPSIHEDDEEEPEEEELIAQATALMEILERTAIRTRSATWIGRLKNIAYEWRTQFVVFGIFIGWVTLSYLAPHLYVYFCAPAKNLFLLVIQPLFFTLLLNPQRVFTMPIVIPFCNTIYDSSMLGPVFLC